jgi:hypothetical protein
MKPRSRICAAASLCSHFVILAFVLVLAHPVGARPLCDPGDVIWYNGRPAGCFFKDWNEDRKATCQGAVAFEPIHVQQPDPSYGDCWVCVDKKYASWITDRSHWPKLKVGFREASARKADFACLGTPNVIELEPRMQVPSRHLEGGTLIEGVLSNPPAEDTCRWTPWLNRDSPGGSGDYETLTHFVAQGKACAEPEQVECRSRDGRSVSETGEVVTCTKEAGAYCVNRVQPGGRRCSDYEVRFCCPAG